MKISAIMTMIGVLGAYVSAENQIDDFQLIEGLQMKLQQISLENKEKREKVREELAPSIYAELIKQQDLKESQLLEKMRSVEKLQDYEYTHIASFRMYEHELHLPRRNALMHEILMQLNKTERGKHLLLLMNEEREVQHAVQRGARQEALALNAQLMKDYEAFMDGEKKAAESSGECGFQTILSTRANMRHSFLLSEIGETPAKNTFVIKMENNPYKEGTIGELQCGGRLPSIDSPVFACKIGEQLKDTMSLAEVYNLLRNELGKGAVPYIFAIKVFGQCVSDDDVNAMRQYVQASADNNGAYTEPEAAYLLAEYLWNDNPTGVTTDFEKWKEGYMMMMQLSDQWDDRASLFILSNVPRSLRDVWNAILELD